VAYRTRWARLLSGAAHAAHAALAATAVLAAAGCTPGPATGASGSHPGTGAVAPVTRAEAARAYAHYLVASATAQGDEDAAAAMSLTTGVAKTAISASNATERYFSLREPAGYVRRGPPVFYLPEPAGYPQWFVVDVPTTVTSVPKLPPGQKRTGAPGGIPWEDASDHVVYVFTKASAAAPWLLASFSKLAPGASLPPLAVDGSGRVPTVPLSDTALLARPDYTGPLQAAVVDDGPASTAAKVMASGQLTTGIYDNERAGLLGLTAPRGDVLRWELEGANYPSFALRTAAGGALVFYAMYLNTTVQTPAALAQSPPPLPPGPPISVPANLAPLLPRGAAPRVELEGQQLLSFAAVDPPAGTGKIQVIAIGGGWSYASTAS